MLMILKTGVFFQSVTGSVGLNQTSDFPLVVATVVKGVKDNRTEKCFLHVTVSFAAVRGDFNSVKQADNLVLSLHSILVMSVQDSALCII